MYTFPPGPLSAPFLRVEGGHVEWTGQRGRRGKWAGPLGLTFKPHVSLLAPMAPPLPHPPADFTSPSPPIWEWCQGEKGTLAQTMCVWEFPPTVEPREGVPVSPRDQ